VLVPVTGLIDEISNPGIWIYPVVRPQLSFRWHLMHEHARPLSTAARLLVDAVVAELAAKRALWTEQCGGRGTVEKRNKIARKGRLGHR
jgi:hypothetical protein